MKHSCSILFLHPLSHNIQRSGVIYNLFLQVVGKDYVDAKVVEAHIVPGKLLLTSLIPTQEVSTVAWDSNGVKVNVSLQPSYAQEGSVMVRSEQDFILKLFSLKLCD